MVFAVGHLAVGFRCDVGAVVGLERDLFRRSAALRGRGRGPRFQVADLFRLRGYEPLERLDSRLEWPEVNYHVVSLRYAVVWASSTVGTFVSRGGCLLTRPRGVRRSALGVPSP